MERKKLTIGHLFPELLNMYGDGGNISALKNRLLWRDMDGEVVAFDMGDAIDFSKLDILLLGGGSDREQQMVCEHLKAMRNELSAYIESGGVFLALCGSYPMIGNSYPQRDETVAGLSLLNIDTKKGEERQIGDAVISSSVTGEETLIVGFENHSGKTYLNGHKPFGTVRYGFGNNGEDGTCGVLYKNLIGTYLHGPLLPKNPALADYLLSCALKRKYGEDVTLSPLFDQAENEAHDFVVKKYAKE